MKYRWGTQIMTRDSGAIMFFCKNKEQAENNVQKFADKLTNGKYEKIISFDTMTDSRNFMLLDEIISVHVIDTILQLDIHKHEILEHKSIEAEIEFQMNNDPTDE